MPYIAWQLKPAEYPNVRSWMLEPRTTGRTVRTFGDRMRDALRQQVEAYVFTAYSAVPIADSVRGYCQAGGLEVPSLHYIHANTKDSRDPERRRVRLAEEIARLTPALESIQSAAIVNQYCCTGKSTAMAVEALKAIGIHNVYVMEETWYHDTASEDVDLANMTSLHATVMHEIGVVAASQDPVPAPQGD